MNIVVKNCFSIFEPEIFSGEFEDLAFEQDPFKEFGDKRRVCNNPNPKT